MKKNVEIRDFSDLSLHIHTIGYPKGGETIVTVLCKGGKVCLTTITDCFLNVSRHYSHIASVLKDYGKPHVDAFIWTHPDEDHTKGLIDVLNEFDSKHSSEVFLPFINMSEWGFLCREADEVLQFLKNNYTGNGFRRQYHPLVADEDIAPAYITLHVVETSSGNELNLNFRCLLPYGPYVMERANKKEKFTVNNLSLFYTIEMNGYRYLFTGDLEEDNVPLLHGDYLNNARFVKIPHHGSDRVKDFVGKLIQVGTKHSIGACTTFNKYEDPKETVLKSYRSCCDSLWVTDKIEKDVKGDADFGCVKLICRFDGSVDTIKSRGNAFQYF